MKRLWKVLVLFALALPLSQCRMITDPGVDVAGGGRGAYQLSARHKACTRVCDRIHDQAREEELELHKEILEKCRALPWEQEKVCREAEHERYRLAKKAIEDQKKTCKLACRYGEGSGDGGR